MADGAGKVTAQVGAPGAFIGGIRDAWRWLFQSRNGLLTIWSVVAALALGWGAYTLYASTTPPTHAQLSYALAASALLLLPLLLFLTDPEATLAQGPRLRLPIVTTGLLAGLTASVVLDHYFWGELLATPPARIAFFSLCACVFLPRIWNAVNFARFKEANRRAAESAVRLDQLADEAANRTDDVEEKIRDYRTAESASAFIVTAVVLLIILAAYYVGSLPKEPSLGAALGVGIFGLVISLFAIVLAIDWLSETAIIREAGRWSRWLAKPGVFFSAFYDWIDSGLVFIGGHVAGADHINALSRYFILSTTLFCLALLGWFLPEPLGLIPVLGGLIIGLSVSRLWSWVEEDRNLASITQFSPKAPQRIGFREDFRDETLLGFIFVLALIPIGMMQAHLSGILGGPLFETNNHELIDAGNFLVWLGYFGFELAKALPIVDWADIYNLGPGNDSISPMHPLGQHAVFAARALVDLLLIAALLQALGIASRNRQQKFLYAERHIDRLDELVEKHEINKAIRATRASASPESAPLFDLTALTNSQLVDFRHYNEARLRELFLKTQRTAIRSFISQLFAERGVKPAPAMVIVQDIAASHRSELDLMRTFDEAKHEHDANIYTITPDDIASVLFELRASSGMREIKFELIDYAARLPDKPKLLQIFTTAAVGAGRDHYLYTRKKAAQAILPIVSEVDDRDVLTASLTEFESRGPEVFGASRQDWEAVVAALRERIAHLLT